MFCVGRRLFDLSAEGEGEYSAVYEHDVDLVNVVDACGPLVAVVDKCKRLVVLHAKDAVVVGMYALPKAGTAVKLLLSTNDSVDSCTNVGGGSWTCFVSDKFGYVSAFPPPSQLVEESKSKQDSNSKQKDGDIESENDKSESEEDEESPAAFPIILGHVSIVTDLDACRRRDGSVLLVTGDRDEKVRTTPDALLQPFRIGQYLLEHTACVTQVRLVSTASSDSVKLVTADYDGNVCVFESPNPATDFTLICRTRVAGKIRFIDVVNDTLLLVACFDSADILSVDLAALTLQRAFAVDGPVLMLRQGFCVTKAGTVYRWDGKALCDCARRVPMAGWSEEGNVVSIPYAKQMHHRS